MGSGNMIVPSTYSSSGLHGAGGMAPAGEVLTLQTPHLYTFMALLFRVLLTCQVGLAVT